MLCWWEDVEDFDDLRISAVEEAILVRRTTVQDPHMERPMKDWIFRVKVNTKPNETVCIVGNCPELGDWRNSRAVQLVKVNENQKDGDIWSAIIRLPQKPTIKFRYYVCFLIDETMDKNHKNEKIVRRWETNPEPRIIPRNAPSNAVEGCKVETHIFGEYDGNRSVDKGWLTTETLVQFKLSNNPIKFWKKKLEKKTIYVKVTPVSLSRYHASESIPTDHDDSLDTLDILDPPSTKWPITEISVLNENEREFRTQQQFGHAYSENDFIIFNVSVTSPENMANYVPLVDDIKAIVALDTSWIGISLALFIFHFLSTVARACLSYLSFFRNLIIYISQNVEYLIVKPIRNLECDMSYSLCKSFTGAGLDIGHRGLGNSFKTTDCSDIRENTIASLKEASSHGADMVEFDVQLTKDQIPVLYHDFHVLIAMKRKRELGEHDMLEIAVKDLTLKQLQLLKIYHLAEKTSERFKEVDSEEHQPFPTLKDALEIVDSEVGFNIEIKWTMQLKDGTYELYHPMELNKYLDIVLKVILEYGANRKIIFSCFNPDICTMLRLKQNRYPVLFLTCGITSKYEPYRDLRTRDIPMAVHNAISSNILGINVHTEDILRDPSQVKYVIDSGLAMFCWGDDNNNNETIKNLKELGLHGIIYDKIDKYITKDKSRDQVYMMDSSKAVQKELIRIAEMAAERDVENQMSEANVRPFTKSPFEPDVDKVLEATAKETASGLTIFSTLS